MARPVLDACAKMIRDDYDNPWKQAVDAYFPDFMAFYFPQAHSRIDWAAGYQSLDGELPALVRDAELGKRYADKLVQVTTADGEQDIVYVHIEVQGQVEKDFAKRMFIYHYRIFDRFERQPVSLAVLADDRPEWKPTGYRYDRWGCGLDFTFPTVKLTDYTDRMDDLQDSNNPFAILTVAHRLTRHTKSDMDERLATKLKIIKLLYQKGWDKQEVLNFFAVIDWMMHLPKELTSRFQQQLAEYEQESKMRYVTSVELLAQERGMQQGMQQGGGLLLRRQLTRRFGLLPGTVNDRLDQASLEQLENWSDRVLDAKSLDEVFGETMQ